jgi:hypothetical protein
MKILHGSKVTFMTSAVNPPSICDSLKKSFKYAYITALIL